MDAIKMFDAYLIYADGRVQNKNTGRFLKPDTSDRRGYLRVTLCTKGTTKRFGVHRLVAMRWIPNPEGKRFVNHKDGNKRNNSVDNLEWVTASENEYHSYRVLGKKVPRGADRWNSKLTDEQVAEIRELRKTHSVIKIAQIFGLSRGYVTDLVSGRYR